MYYLQQVEIVFNQSYLIFSLVRSLLFVFFNLLFHIERTFDAHFCAETSKLEQRHHRRLRKQRRAIRNRRTVENDSCRRSSLRQNAGQHVRLQVGAVRAEQETVRGKS